MHITGTTRQEFTLAGFFGTLHPEWPPEPFLTIWQRAEQVRQKQPVLLAMGRLGPGKALWEELPARYPGIKFANLGEQPSETISHYLQMLDFGIATSPVRLLGKSGTVAAMLDTGLSVVANRDDWTPHTATTVATSATQIHVLDLTLKRDLSIGLARHLARDRIGETANTLISLLAPCFRSE